MSSAEAKRKKRRYDDGYRRSESKQLAPGFIPLKEEITQKEINWTEKAACKGFDVADFFPEDGFHVSEEVREMCNGCPVKFECYIYAEKNRLDNFGVFGGYSPKQRRDMRSVTGRNSPKFKQLAA